MRRLERLVGGDVPQVEGPLRLESRKYLGASYVFLGRRDDAERQFAALLAEDPQHQLDPVAFSRDVITLFDRVRSRLAEAREREAESRRAAEEVLRREEAQRLVRERERLLRLEELAAQEIVEVRNSRFLASIPFGVGQFQNGDETLGWVFAASGAVLAISSIVTGIVYLNLTEQLVEAQALDVEANAATVEDIRSARNATALINRLSILLLGVVGIAGVVDAHVRYVPSRREVRRRAVPDDAHEGEPDPEPAQPEAPQGTTAQSPFRWSLTPFGGQAQWAF